MCLNFLHNISSERKYNIIDLEVRVKFKSLLSCIQPVWPWGSFKNPPWPRLWVVFYRMEIVIYNIKLWLYIQKISWDDTCIALNVEPGTWWGTQQMLLLFPPPPSLPLWLLFPCPLHLSITSDRKLLCSKIHHSNFIKLSYLESIPPNQSKLLTLALHILYVQVLTSRVMTAL